MTKDTGKKTLTTTRSRPMTDSEFDVVLKLIRDDPQSYACRAARAVLVNQQKQIVTAMRYEITKTQVGEAVARYREAHALILTAYNARVPQSLLEQHAASRAERREIMRKLGIVI